MRQKIQMTLMHVFSTVQHSFVKIFRKNTSEVPIYNFIYITCIYNQNEISNHIGVKYVLLYDAVLLEI